MHHTLYTLLHYIMTFWNYNRSQDYKQVLSDKYLSLFKKRVLGSTEAHNRNFSHRLTILNSSTHTHHDADMQASVPTDIHPDTFLNNKIYDVAYSFKTWPEKEHCSILSITGILLYNNIFDLTVGFAVQPLQIFHHLCGAVVGLYCLQQCSVFLLEAPAHLSVFSALTHHLQLLMSDKLDQVRWKQ